jgi:glycosyltransferase involved in cell wall biosynthesis
MRVVIVWFGVTGYLAAGWRALARRQGIELHVVAEFQRQTTALPFDASIMEGIPCTLADQDPLEDFDYTLSLVKPHRPEILVVSGWVRPTFAQLVDRKYFPDAKFVMGMDTPLKPGWRQSVGRLKLKAFVGNFDRVVVAGERSWQYARFLGVPEAKVRRGVYGLDYERFMHLHGERAKSAGGWPKGFLYFGRYDKEKALDVLVAAYRLYRGRVGEGQAWPLTCCGKGSQGALLNGEPGIVDRGFLQPADQPKAMLEHGVFVLPSRYEPWGVVIGEACAAGMPVVCTEACGASVELVRSYYNGITVATEDAQALARAMLWMHEHHGDLAEMGGRGVALAAAYSAESWATRWVEMFNELQAEGR